MTVIPLGTASAWPTRGRHLSALALELDRRFLLFDCGEGTQFQLRAAGLKLSRLEGVFLSHLHGDHCFGLPGLLSTLAMLGRERPLSLVGPLGTERFVRCLPGWDDTAQYPIHFSVLPDEVDAVVWEGGGTRVMARPLEHRVPVVGYRVEGAAKIGRLDADRARDLGVTEGPDFGRLKRGEVVTTASGSTVRPEDVLGPPRPGPTFAYVTDTRPHRNGVWLGRAADLLYHEATFKHDAHERAVETTHSTAVEAARVAREAEARMLLLGHFSARYADPEEVAAEARTVFENTHAAVELKRYPIVPVP